MLALNLEREKLGERRLSQFNMNKEITPLKKQPQYQWLNEVSAGSLQAICGDLNHAYENFFNGVCRKPKFKKKRKLKEYSLSYVTKYILKTTILLSCR